MTDYLTQVERQLEAAEAEIARLEGELRQWRSGAKSLAMAQLEDRLSERSAD